MNHNKEIICDSEIKLWRIGYIIANSSMKPQVKSTLNLEERLLIKADRNDWLFHSKHKYKMPLFEPQYKVYKSVAHYFNALISGGAIDVNCRVHTEKSQTNE